MEKIISRSVSLICLFLLLISCSKNDDSIGDGDVNPGNSKSFIAAKFNGKLKEFNFLTSGKLTDNNQLLSINGFPENNSLSPTLELNIKKVKGKITAGTYNLYDSPDIHIDARYTINRLEDGALLSNTFYETRDIGNKNDLIITITSLANGRVAGTFSGVIKTEEEVKGDTLITLTEGKFDVSLD